MKTNFFLAAVFAAIAAVNAETTYVCETSDASPYLHNVQELIDNLNDAPQGENQCNPGPENGCGKTITGYSGSGGAAYMICGPGMRCSGDPGGIPCTVSCGGMVSRLIGDYFEVLRDKCQAPDSNGDIRVGGIVRMTTGDEVNELKLFSKPG
ncbi:hypothetical protein N7468_004238 [Penicillium chermesinum]|uniref:Uncharacterized protein n=1 Tax=Penicillium chermesinum TaxID=63820 RepID=A0A9W9TU51_9EURO|nr:uncharacterized protein N7468_004238 [Penicillium chermesinum]KAJ5239619.1 hypothetical protein N7468_004238 [Penicillium chermesinum]KAJ6166510.1 hypothetical protein N7470_001957 [Penicillium chermesinum]